MNTIYDAIVIGAGQAGLATGYHFQQAGFRFLGFGSASALYSHL